MTCALTSQEKSIMAYGNLMEIVPMVEIIIMIVINGSQLQVPLPKKFLSPMKEEWKTLYN